MKKTACVIYYSDERFERMALNAKNSFKRFHSDINVYLYNSYNYTQIFQSMKPAAFYPAGIIKYMLALWVAEAGKYEKVIILGADTIVCDRLEEFLHDDESDAIATLDYNYPLSWYLQSVNEDFKVGTTKDGVPIYAYGTPAFISPLAVITPEGVSSESDLPICFKRESDEEVLLVNPNPFLKDAADEDKILINPNVARVATIYDGIISNKNVYQYQFLHLNADIICFNNLSFLEYINCFSVGMYDPALRSENDIPSSLINFYNEQGALNFCTFAGMDKSYKPGQIVRDKKFGLKSEDMFRPNVSIPELSNENIIYNVRSQKPQKNAWKENSHKNKEDIILNTEATKKDIDFIKQYYVDNNKLFTSEGKQIKVWHYCDDFGGQSHIDFKKLETRWNNIFNKETREFFSNNCDGDYFK